MVDPERLRSLLDSVADARRRLGPLASRDAADLLADEIVLDAIKYRLVTAIEGSIDVAQHVIASEGFGTPDTNAGAFDRLAEHGVLETDLAGSLRRAVAFRNVLVHGYRDVDDALVVDALGRLGDFDRFVAAVSRYVTSEE